MPLYEYECTSCHRRTEKIQKFSDADLTLCPYCGGPLERTITAAAVAFKGGGWFKDGYASAKPPASGGDSSSGAASSDSGARGSGSAGSSAAAAGSGESATSGDSAKPAAAPAASPAPASAPATTTKA